MTETNQQTQPGSTTVKTVEVQDINEVLGLPSADSVMVPGKEKPSIFSTSPVDMSFIDKDDDEEVVNSNVNKDDSTAAVVTNEVIDDTLKIETPENDDDSTSNAGRKKVSKDALVEVTKKLIEANKLIPFEDDKPIEEYSTKDFEELLEANFQEKENKLREEVSLEFFDSLPDELQIAAKYVADGGTDLKSLFKTLAQVEEMRELDPSQESDQESIVRNYLHATNFGTAEEIEEEINGWKDRGELENKANKFKPKLDAMQQQIVTRQLQQQERLKSQQQAQLKAYSDSIYKVLEPGELNGIKIDRKTQELLYTGLLNPNYPSITGKPTNLFGHLIEKYQFVEPNHSLIAEALYLLADPDGYKEKIRTMGEKAATEKTVRMLKTEERNKNTSSTVDDNDDAKRSTKPQGIKRPGNNFFKRS